MDGKKTFSRLESSYSILGCFEKCTPGCVFFVEILSFTFLCEDQNRNLSK